jgi:plastocyanin
VAQTRRILLALTTLACLSSPSSAASIEGTVRLLHPPAPQSEPITLYPRRGLEGPHKMESAPLPGCNCVVYLAGAPAEPPPAVPDTVTIMQQNERFIPHVLPIRTGSVVRFPNGDPFFHNVFSYSKSKRFDLGKYPSGHSKSVRFMRAGLVEVFCEIHAFMNAYILVLPHSYFASPSADGRFVIQNVPPGRYRLTVWRPGEDSREQPVVVSEGDRSVEVQIDL